MPTAKRRACMRPECVKRRGALLLLSEAQGTVDALHYSLRIVTLRASLAESERDRLRRALSLALRRITTLEQGKG